MQGEDRLAPAAPRPMLARLGDGSPGGRPLGEGRVRLQCEDEGICREAVESLAFGNGA